MSYRKKRLKKVMFVLGFGGLRAVFDFLLIVVRAVCEPAFVCRAYLSAISPYSSSALPSIAAG